MLSATFIYRQQRIWGASPVVASWQLVMSGALQVIGLALLGLGSAFMLGAKQQPVVADLFTLGGFIALIVLAQAVAIASGPASTASGCVCCRGSTRCAANPPTPAWTSGAKRSTNSNRCS